MRNKFQTEPNIGKRIGATIIDYVIILGFTTWFVLQFGEPNDEGGKTVTGPLAMVPILFWFLLLVIPETLWGTTIGHRFNSLKIVSFSGSNPTLGQSIKRRFADILEISWCFGLIAFILVKNSDKNQRLGDIWAKTLVVDKNTNFEIMDFEFETGPH